MPLRLFVIDDHDVVRVGLRTALQQQSGWQVCGEAADGENALAKIPTLAPDVVILDVSLPGLPGTETAKQIRRIAPSTKIILFSIHNVPTVASAVGADAFVSKGAGLPALHAAIERVISRER